MAFFHLFTRQFFYTQGPKQQIRKLLRKDQDPSLVFYDIKTKQKRSLKRSKEDGKKATQIVLIEAKNLKN